MKESIHRNQPSEREPSDSDAHLRALESDDPGLFEEESDIDQVEQAPQTNRAPDIAASFAEFYRVYPRHVAKGAAEKAYRRITARGEATADELLNGAMRYAAERQDQDQNFTKHPATWLNGRCWLDEAAPPPSPARASIRDQVLEGARRAMETMLAAESEVLQ